MALRRYHEGEGKMTTTEDILSELKSVLEARDARICALEEIANAAQEMCEDEED